MKKLNIQLAAFVLLFVANAAMSMEENRKDIIKEMSSRPDLSPIKSMDTPSIRRIEPFSYGQGLNKTTGTRIYYSDGRNIIMLHDRHENQTSDNTEREAMFQYLMKTMSQPKAAQQEEMETNWDLDVD